MYIWPCINHHVSPILNIDAPVITLAKDSEKVLNLGPFVCLSVWLFVCLSVCLSAQYFHAFLHNFLLDCDGIFSIGATTHVECSNDEYDIIGHMVLQPYWKNGEKIGPLYLWNCTKENIETWHIAMISEVPSLWYAYIECIYRMPHICIYRTPHQISMKFFDRYLGIKWSTEKKFMTSVVWVCRVAVSSKTFELSCRNP